MQMNKSMSLSLALAVLAVSLPLMAQEPGVAKPNLLLKETLQGMPVGKTQEVQVLTATLKPGDKTPFHTHRFPVTVYIPGRCIYIGDGGARASHGESRSSHSGTAPRENDRL
jgi:hypothetical protein